MEEIKKEEEIVKLSPEEETKKIMMEQTRLLGEIAKDMRTMRRAAIFGRITSAVVFFLFFVLPIIISIFVLPKLISGLSSTLGGAYGGQTGGQPVDIMQVITNLFK